VEPWRAALDAGDIDTAWTLFLARYHRLIGATVARCIPDAEDARDAFAELCDKLWEGELKRLRRFHEESHRSAKFSTWLVVVVRNLAIDWRRSQDGRPRPTPPPGLTSLREQIYRLVLVERRSHSEAYEVIRARSAELCSFPHFLREVAETYRAVDARRWSHLAMHRILAHERSEGADGEGEALEIDVQQSRLPEALSRLSESEREAIRLFIVEERPAAEVALALGWPNSKSVYNRVRRALAVLRARLAGVAGALPPK
jgi:RNA polymerase sigma factor (sigma-70 family)